MDTVKLCQWKNSVLVVVKIIIIIIKIFTEEGLNHSRVPFMRAVPLDVTTSRDSYTMNKKSLQLSSL